MPTPPATKARVLAAFDTEEDRFLPEGPRAMTVLDREAIVWVNIQTDPKATRGAVHVRFWDTGERRRYALPARPGFIFPTDIPNVVLLGLEKAVGTLNLASGMWTPLGTIPDTNPRVIINDGEIVPGGRAIVFGTKDTKFESPIAALYLFTLADQELTTLADGQICSNGKVFASDAAGLILYDIDTPRKEVTRYRLDVARRMLTHEGTAVDLKNEEAFPDGMCGAADGTVIVAFYNPHRGGVGKAGRYRLGSGELVEEWLTPSSPRVTCPLLVNHDGGVKLVLTTATEGMEDEKRKDSPDAGNLFIADTTLPAVPAAELVRL